MKSCSICKEIKDSSCFYKAKKNKDGLYSYCKPCDRTKRDLWKLNNPKKQKAITKQIRSRRLDKQRIAERIWQKENPEKRKASIDKYFNNPLNKEKKKKSNKAWHKKNKHKNSFYCATRKTSKIQATPSWLTKEQLKEIETIYKNCPKGYAVDHIVPLRGKTVSGLHVPWNLQYLTKSENSKKSNKF